MSTAGAQASLSGSRRGAIVEAMIRAAGRKGYRAVTVEDAIGEAGTSRATFYKHFNDKYDCFLAAYDLAAKRVLAAVEAACEAEWSWLERTRAGLGALVELLAADPALARTVVVEAVAAGAETRQRQVELIGHIARGLERGSDATEPVLLPANTGLMAASAVNGLLFEEVQRGRAGQLPAQLPDLLFALLVPFLGPQRAIEEMRYARLRASRIAAASPDSAT
jgi:AcrR family transcriptional regulator